MRWWQETTAIQKAVLCAAGDDATAVPRLVIFGLDGTLVDTLSHLPLFPGCGRPARRVPTREEILERLVRTTRSSTGWGERSRDGRRRLYTGRNRLPERQGRFPDCRT
jgi:hypothetical protein